MLSVSRLTLALTLTAAIAAFVLLVQDVAPKGRPAVNRSVAVPVEMMKIVPAEADRDTRDWHMSTGDNSAN